MKYEAAEGESANPDFENPEVVVRFSGQDVDLLLANKAELLLALEYITMEALHIPSDDHSRISFDAQDYRALAHRRTAHERGSGGGKSEAHRAAVQIQSDEQPRTPRHPPGDAERDGAAQ